MVLLASCKVNMAFQSRRVAHIMRQTTKASYPTNFLFFDTETKGEKRKDDKTTEYHTLWFGCVYAFRREGDKRTREVQSVFTTINEFWCFLIKRLDAKRPLYVFAHNLGFDLTIVDFWNQSEAIPIEIELPVIDDPPNFFVCKINGCPVTFV